MSGYPAHSYEPDAGRQADIEAEEFLRSRRLERRIANMERELAALREVETVCCLCGVHMSGPTGQPPERVSHGLCERCERGLQERETVTPPVR